MGCQQFESPQASRVFVLLRPRFCVTYTFWGFEGQGGSSVLKSGLLDYAA